MMSTRRARGVGALAAAAVLTAVVAALMAGGAGAGSQSALALPREQTLYMSGNQWSPNTDLNPAKNWDYVTGLVGFVYETPFRYDPLKDKFIPWLATTGKWTSKTTYTMTIRKGVKWSDGQTMTPQDVKYSFDLAQDRDPPAAPALGGHRPEEHEGARATNVVFTFAGNPGYQQFDFYRYNVAVVPQHVFKSYEDRHRDRAT